MALEHLFESVRTSVFEDVPAFETAAPELLKEIQDHLSDKKGVVQIYTALKYWTYKNKHRDWFKLSKDGKHVLVRRGKNWDSIMFSGIRFGYIK